jgi:hypothetical protein
VEEIVTCGVYVRIEDPIVVVEPGAVFVQLKNTKPPAILFAFN